MATVGVKGLSKLNLYHSEMMHVIWTHAKEYRQIVCVECE